MKLNVGRAVATDPEGTAWGMAPSGMPVFMVTQGGYVARVEFSSHEEAKQHGVSAIFVAVDSELKVAEATGRPPQVEGAAQPASILFAPSGAPLRRG